MIIIKFSGGLGNQMFEYAFYKSIKKKYTNCNVVADVSGITCHNDYEIYTVFGINVKECTWKHVAKLSDAYPKNGRFYKFLDLLFKIKLMFRGSKESYIRQDDCTAFYNEIYDLNQLKSYYLYGVWANEMYFENVKEELREDFQFKGELGIENEKILKDIQKSNSVSIHIRRGDYLKYGFNIINRSFYEKAIAIIKTKIEKPRFFVFSDNIEDTKKLLKGLGEFIYVNQNSGKDSYKDMWLISKCKHNIISNSTFSFWGAWLNENSDKIVIAPNVSCEKSQRYPYTCKGWTMIDMDENREK